jgi:ribosomal protein S26
MGSRRGRDRLVYCTNCGRAVPRSKAMSYQRRTRFSTDLRGDENVSYIGNVDVYYCISCAKHLGIGEKKRKMLQRRREGEYRA